MSLYKEEQREICREKANYMCQICAKNGKFNRGNQCAHMIPQKDWIIKKYGSKIIHHHSNLEYVCSTKCNSKAMIPEYEYEDKVEQIKRRINDE